MLGIGYRYQDSRFDGTHWYQKWGWQLINTTKYDGVYFNFLFIMEVTSLRQQTQTIREIDRTKHSMLLPATKEANRWI